MITLSVRSLISKKDILDTPFNLLDYNRQSLEKKIREAAREKGVVIVENTMTWSWWDEQLGLGDEEKPVEMVKMELRCLAE